MRVVIQCAARKHPAEASFGAPDARVVLFVADPALAPPDPTHVYARPDDPAEDGRSWRRRLLEYNEAKTNPLNLLPAYRLYAHSAYGELVQKFGMDNVFILSAGWGLVRADFRLPHYDITFSARAEPWKRRRENDAYADFRMIPDDGGAILFLGGNDYQPLFCKLTANFSGDKVVLYNAAQRPPLPPGFRAARFETARRTNWHYEAAASLVEGRMAWGSGLPRAPRRDP
jgi:hypothetical protein